MLEDPIARLFGALYDMEHQGLISFLERGIVKGFYYLIIQGSERVSKLFSLEDEPDIRREIMFLLRSDDELSDGGSTSEALKRLKKRPKIQILKSNFKLSQSPLR